MKDSEKVLPESELTVMMIIWESQKERLSTGEIFNLLNNKINWKLSTLQIVLSRLTEKGFLRIEKIGRLNYYYALVDGKNYKRFETQNFIKKMFNNSKKKLIASLIEEDESLSKQDIEDIKKILNKGGEI